MFQTQTIHMPNLFFLNYVTFVSILHSSHLATKLLAHSATYLSINSYPLLSRLYFCTMGT